MQANTILMAEQCERGAEDAAKAADLARFKAKRARLLAGTYSVGVDHYGGDFFRLSERPPAELRLTGGSDEARSLHRLPNGDWIEIIGNSMSWVRHTYDTRYALDRARRAAIGGYSIRQDLLMLICEIKSVGANNCGTYSLWQDVTAERPYAAAYLAEGNKTAPETQQHWIDCLEKDAIGRHTKHASLIRRTIDLLRQPDVLREYPASIDPQLAQLTRDLTEAVTAANG